MKEGMWNDLKYHHELIKIFQQCHSSVYCKIIFTKFIPGAVLDQYWDFSMETLFNPLVHIAPFLYPLETSENLTGLGFHGVEKGCFGKRWVNVTLVVNLVVHLQHIHTICTPTYTHIYTLSRNLHKNELFFGFLKIWNISLFHDCGYKMIAKTNALYIYAIVIF